MRQIFISHANNDVRTIEDKLKPYLEEKGLTPWFSKTCIPSGNGIIEIYNNLQRSDYFLLVMSENSKTSEWVKAETYAWFAMGRSVKKFLPFRIDMI